MNYIAHIHLAHLTNTSLVGNFLGDFVKGSDLSHLPPQFQQGVLLHRKIDSYTDRHEISVKIRRKFPANIRRMSGVIMDVYFDHLLCKFWQSFTRQDLDDVLETFYSELEHAGEISSRFERVKESLLNSKWLSNYVHEVGYQQAFHHIENRLNRKILFANAGTLFIEQNRNELESLFLNFYPSIIEYVSLLVDKQHPNVNQ